MCKKSLILWKHSAAILCYFLYTEAHRDGMESFQRMDQFFSSHLALSKELHLLPNAAITNPTDCHANERRGMEMILFSFNYGNRWIFDES